MAILRRCCCWKDVRSGSFACGIYTLIFFTIVLTGGAFNVHTVVNTPVILIMSLSMLMFSGACVVSSVLLLIGLCVDSRILLLPWIASVSVTTMLDILFSLYLIIEANFGSFLSVLFAIDVFTCVLNIYCLLCVISQYQEYSAGEGRNFQGYGRQEFSAHCQMPQTSTGSRSPKSSADKQTFNNATSETQVLLAPSQTEGKFQPSIEVSFISEDPSTTTTSLQEYQRRESTDIQDRQRKFSDVSLNIEPKDEQCNISVNHGGSQVLVDTNEMSTLKI